MRTKAIHQVVTIEAPPSEVYDSLMDSKRHSQLTGCTAKISRKVGGSFTAMESLRGKNLELVPDRKIVQTWQCDYDGWPSNHFSTLTIRLKPAEGSTRLDLDQVGVPAQCVKGIREAWHKYYWRPLKKMLRQKSATNP
jgi:activator of HSP90 ATPase